MMGEARSTISRHVQSFIGPALRHGRPHGILRDPGSGPREDAFGLWHPPWFAVSSVDLGAATGTSMAAKRLDWAVLI